MHKNIFHTSSASIYPEIYTIYSTDSSQADAFLNIIDDDEITVISTQAIESYNHKSENWIRISISIDVPPESTGIAAMITSEFAKSNISIVPVASFSKAHIFVKKSDRDGAIQCLKDLGIDDVTIQ